MAERVVLIPFRLVNSTEFVLATKGGVSVPGVDDTHNKAQHEYAVLAKEMNEFQPIAAQNKGKKEFDDALERGLKEQEAAKKRLDQAEANYKGALKPGWKNIDSTRIACSDDGHRHAMLRLLKDRDDVLYIRGHCDSGLNYMESSDHMVRVKAKDVVDLLDGSLRRNFNGAIKLMGCKSASDTIFKQSFASRFAEALADRGFVKARVFGYTAYIHTFMPPSGHKTTKDGRRASQTRVQIPMNRVRSSKCCMQ